MTSREKLGLDLAREILGFVDGFAHLDRRERLAHVLALDLSDRKMEELRISSAARNARAQASERRVRR